MADASDPKFTDFDEHRSWLRVLAHLHLPEALRRKCDPSDIVQQTLLKAHQGREFFRGQAPAEKEAWLRRILANILTDTMRQYGRAKRDAGLERSLKKDLERSSANLDSFLQSQHTSPSDRAIRNERLLKLGEALLALPDDQRKAVEMHHLQGYKLSEIAEKLGRSDASVAGLLRRGLKQLRQHMEAASGEQT